MTDPKTDPFRQRRRTRRRWTALAVFLVLLAALSLGGLAMMGRPVAAPDWLRDKIVQRIDESLPGLRINFGRMSLEVSRKGQPRVILWDVDLRNALGEQIAALSDIEAGFSPAAMLRGEMVLQSAQVSGAFVTLQRDAQGRFGLALGDVFSAGTRTPDLPQIITEIDQIIADPRLADLDLFEADALTIRYEDIRAHRGWTADGGRIRLARQDGKLAISGDLALLAGGDSVATIEMNAESVVGSARLDFGLKLNDLWSRDIATQTPALAWLEVLEAPISGALRSSVAEDGSLGPLNATLQIGAGVLRANRNLKPIPFDGARTYLTYLPDRAQLRFDEISVQSELLAVSAEGKATLENWQDGWPSALTAQFSLPQVTLAQGALLDRALEVKGAQTAFKLTFNPFQLSLGNLRLTDPEFPLRATGELAAYSDGWDVALDARIAETTPEQVLSFWPQTRGTKTRDWLTANVKEGRVHDAVYALRLHPGQEKPSHFLDLRFDDARLTYNPKLPELTGGSGRLTLYDKRLGIHVDKGFSDPGQGGAIDLAGSQFVIPDMSIKPAPAIIRIKAGSSLTAALSYIDNDTWRVLRKAGRSADMATGRAEVSGEITLPLAKGIKLPDIDLNLKGVLRDVKSDSLIPGRSLAADRLDMTLDNDAVAISGPVTLSGVPATGQWRQPLGGGAGRVTAQVTMTPETLKAVGVTLPAGMISGKGIGNLDLTLEKGSAPGFTLTSTLAGLGLAIPQLGWQLPQGATGNFQIAGTLGKPIRIDGMSLSGAGLSANGTLALADNGQFEALRLSRLSLGDWLDVTATLRGRGRGVAPGIEVSAGRVDLRSAPFGAGGGGTGSGGAPSGGGGPLSLTLDRLQVTDSIWLSWFRGDFDLARGLEGRFDGQLGGSAQVRGQVIPQSGRSAFRVRGEDAGDILKAAGILKTVQNGTFRLDLGPVRGTSGSYDGHLTIEGPRLRNAPAIGALLDAISIVGLLDQANGPGIFFSEVEARFRLTPSTVVLTQSSAVGPSMGISMDGYYDMKSGTMDMQGVVSPIYILNGIGRLISRKGEGLIGFNFNLRGPVTGPRVSVNPLSVFTPGMFRDIFRRPPPEVAQ
ncbi:YhdP family protein [Tropicibacter oceani]|uniref:AsmA-like C-terminal region-containing protein n=1 Tax=Tropicibacter oceani TaxID=3058420 RepID=A0ABY8QF33_9RHOB|nr:AsmA-like C-terminal region-containing protein [Tropicibacter oceani]WGW03210.1 AsmA-like C-terminal region-containing protein [Tropicibacter oceani]